MLYFIQKTDITAEEGLQMSISKSKDKQHFYSYLLHDQRVFLYFAGLLKKKKKHQIKSEQEKKI